MERLRISVRRMTGTGMYEYRYNGNYIGQTFVKNDGSLYKSPLLIVFCKQHGL